jgi:muramidase (phage lysozyme)
VKLKDEKATDFQLLEKLIKRFIEKLEKNGFEPKVQDVLKAIQLKQKLAQTSEAEKIFWELIDQLRKE